MESPYTPPQTEMTSPKSAPWKKWLLWGCLGSVFFFILLIASCVLFIKGAVKTGGNVYGPTCAQYLGLLESKDFSGAYEMGGDEFKKSMSKEKHNALMAGIEDRLGPVKKMEIQSVFSGIDQNGSWGTVIYKADFQKGPGTIKFGLRKVNGKIVLTGVSFNSPILTDFFNDSLSHKQ